MAEVDTQTMQWVDYGLASLLITAVWIMANAAVAWYSNWHAFSRVFTRLPYVKGRKHYLNVIACGPSALPAIYLFCINITVGEDAIYLKPYFFLRPFHKSMRISYRSIISCDSFLVCGCKLRFVELPLPLWIVGSAALKIRARLDHRFNRSESSSSSAEEETRKLA